MSEADRLRRIHRGVYAVGHAAIPNHGRCLAAILASPEGAVLSHASAAWLWGLQHRCPSPAEVTIIGHGHRRKGISTHHVGSLSNQDWGTIARIPVTSLARTLLDLAATGGERGLQRAIERAERLGLLDTGEILAMLERRPRAAGRVRLRAALEIYCEPIFSRARSERLFLALCRRGGLPAPAINTFVAGHEIDAYWATERFAVEVDGWDTHRTRGAFEKDPLRQEDLLLAGITSIRVTARRIERKPELVAERLATHLDRRRRELAQPERSCLRYAETTTFGWRTLTRSGRRGSRHSGGRSRCARPRGRGGAWPGADARRTIRRERGERCRPRRLARR